MEKSFIFAQSKKGPDRNPARSLSNIQAPFGTGESPSGLINRTANIIPADALKDHVNPPNTAVSPQTPYQ